MSGRTIAGPDYHDWGVAMQWRAGPFNAVLRFSDTDHTDDECPEICGARLVIGAGIEF